MGAEEQGSRKKKIIRIVVGVVVAAVIVVWFILSRDSYHYDGVVRSTNETYKMINDAVARGKGEIYYESAINPEFLDFFTIMDNATQNGSYDGCEIYGMRYEYNYSPNGYSVHLHLSDPSMKTSLLTKIRVKWIASQFEDLNDYEKIKGVHDYLVLLNRYVAFEGGAYSALYKGRSSCTGYAFSFYAIMRELGVDVTIEIGESHAWNRVKFNGKWYNIDVTWDDNGVDEVSYDYFMKCDADWRGHHHGGSDAEASMAPVGKSAKEYYRMVPNYILITEILMILLMLIPITILGIHLYKKKKREAPIAAGQMMVIGNWTFMKPFMSDGKFEVIRKMCASPLKKDIWGVEDGVYFHETDNEAENIHEKKEVTSAQFYDELDFTISVCRSNNVRELCDVLMDAKEKLLNSNG